MTDNRQPDLSEKRLYNTASDIGAGAAATPGYSVMTRNKALSALSFYSSDKADASTITDAPPQQGDSRPLSIINSRHGGGAAIIAPGDFLLSKASPKYAPIIHELHLLLGHAVQVGAGTTPLLTINVSEYAKLRGIDRKTANKLLTEFYERYVGVAVRWTEKEYNAKTKEYIEREHKYTPIAYGSKPGDKGRKKDGNYIFRFEQTYFEYISKEPQYMYFPLQMRSIPDDRAYAICFKIAHDKSLNIGKPGENIYSVKSLLDAGGIEYQQYSTQKTSKTGKQYIDPNWKRAKDALEKALDIQQAAFKWKYCKAKGETLTDADKQLTAAGLSFWLDLYIKVTWQDYPAMTAYRDRGKRIAEGRQRRRQAAKMKKAIEAGLTPDEIEAAKTPRRRRRKANAEAAPTEQKTEA